MERVGEFVFQVAPGQPGADDKSSFGPVHRNVTAEKGLSEFRPADSLYDLFQKSTRQFPGNDCLGWRPKGQGPYVFDSYTTVAEKIAAAASAMAHAGVTAHSRAGIYSKNCPEWMTVMQACNRMTVCTVPLYDTLGKNAVEYVATHSETSIIFVSTENWAKLAAALPALRSQVHTVVYWGPGGVNEQEATSLGIKVCDFVGFLAIGRAHPAEPAPPKTDDICTIMYTSGTTGQPKGVMITHGMLLAAIGAIRGYIANLSYVDSFSDDDAILSFLPLAHIMDRLMEELMLYVGGKIGYYSGSLETLVDDIAALRPTLLIGVPRVWERVHAGVMDQLKNSRITRRWLFDSAFNRKLRFLEEGWPQDQASPFFDRLVFSKVKARLGGRVRIALSGAAPLARNLEDFMRVCLCCYFIQGYGLTESCSTGFCSTGFKEHAGTVGIPMPVIDYRLESVPELGYDALGSPPRGEILMRGPCIFPGYYKDAGLTAKVLDKEGWFHTGDIGEQTPTEALKIIDRKKEIFKLAQGEYCSPARVETAYLQLPLIAQLFVYANYRQTALVAVVVPEEGPFVAAARKAGLAGSFQELVRSPVAKSMLLRKMDGTAKSAGLQGFERVRGIILEAEPFSVENNLLTPTLKLKRPQLQERYKMYACQTS